jgi:hypothetical protein
MIEITEADSYPENANSWSRATLKTYNKYRDFNSAYLRYAGIAGNNGDVGDPLSSERRNALEKAFVHPYDVEEIRKQFYDMAGFCIPCNKFYCIAHWDVSDSAFGYCPEGHGKSLDPHWTPEF